ncbi:MAG: hypothetical protein KDC98_22920 [Planctomycetes bacterium]|nr:hypothetical protein [Planctomycetota bacterium]
MKTLRLLSLLLGPALAAQTITVFPDEYAAVPEGPFSSPNLPLASGTSRVQIVYEAVDLAIPSGHQITRVGFREDGGITQVDPGHSLQLEIRMGYTQETALTLGGNFANNYSSTPVTVFGPGLYTLPPLRDANSPLPNGQLFINLTTPFAYDPSLGNLVVEYLIYGNSNAGAAWTYRLDRGDYYSPVTNGPAGCPGSSGIPSLTLQPLRPGLYFSAMVTNAPSSSFGLLILDFGNRLQTPFSLQSLVPGIQPSCMGQISLAGPSSLPGLTNTSGSKNWSFIIPNNAAFIDYDISCQAAFFDFFVPGGAIVSNGAHVLVASRPRTSILAASGPPAVVTTGSVSQYYHPVAFFAHQ